MFLLFRKANIEDPPDCSDYEHYLKNYIYSTGLLFREADIRTHPTAASMNILNIAEVSYSERLKSWSHQTAASMNIIRASGFEK
jgi:hypothetical protein